MWGTPHRLPQKWRCGRFIPTHVGNTRSPGSSRRRGSVHPHACGEHELCRDLLDGLNGSSPRMWGTPQLRLGAKPNFRFIPTHVGNTKTEIHRSGPPTVHPHACGEHFVSSMFSASSFMRFIPTHVGNTRQETDAWTIGAVHPHACGEHDIPRLIRRPDDGSSPRMWGTLINENIIGDILRFIPTHVGNTTFPIVCSTITAVHPHACGEHLKLLLTNRRMTGSSPRMWGTRHPDTRNVDKIRFIPTHVGNTHCLISILFAVSVHPHACGEHAWGDIVSGLSSVHPHACGEHRRGRIVVGVESGSSPRMWGTRPGRGRSRRGRRFIPTHVGNTPVSIGI